MFEPEVKTKGNFTWKDFENLPEGTLCQLIGGQLITSPSPSFWHQLLLSLVFQVLNSFVRKKNLGLLLLAPIDVYLSQEEVYQPDLVFISNARIHLIKEQGIFGAPDFVLEVLSPQTAYYDLRHKKAVYARAGVKEYWIADPLIETFETYHNNDGKFILKQEQATGTLRSELFGFELDLDQVFAELKNYKQLVREGEDAQN